MAKSRRLLQLIVAILMVLAIPLVGISPAHAIEVEGETLISASPTGEPADEWSSRVVINNDARFVAFASTASNLIPGLEYPTAIEFGGKATQTFLYDRQTQTMEVISKSTAGDLANNTSNPVSISDDGRFVLFLSRSNNLVSNWPSQYGREGVYLRDRQAGTTVMVNSPSLNSAGAASRGAMTPDGTLVVYQSSTGAGSTSVNHTYIWNRVTGDTTALPSDSFHGAQLSRNGQYVYFHPVINVQAPEVHRYTIATGESELILPGTYNGFAVSADDSLILYQVFNTAENNVDVFVKNINTGNVTTIYENSAFGAQYFMSISDNNRLASFLTKDEGSPRQDGQLRIADLTTGEQLLFDDHVNRYNDSAMLNGDGSELAFVSSDRTANAIEQVFVAQLSVPTATLPAPTGLSAQTPANNPMLTWNAVAGAETYGVYRDGAQIGTATDTTYTDTSAPEGTHEYTVTAMSGETTSEQSAAVTVLVDKTAPTVGTPTINRLALFNLPVTIQATASDALSGVQSAEYYIDTDPGQGNGTPMTYANGQASITTPLTGISTGFHMVFVRTLDSAGNWSAPKSTWFIYIGQN